MAVALLILAARAAEWKAEDVATVHHKVHRVNKRASQTKEDTKVHFFRRRII